MSDIDLIITDYLPETGLGLAINDRLQRAAAKLLILDKYLSCFPIT